ncbi:MAG: glycosyltransferase family 4 protein, partial [Methanomicrobiales archaeon]|nr:glycosyltransferase family 4 protein [Methanomicrobiales archaeon]
RMKIAFVYDAVYPYRIGGVEQRIYELSKRLAARGHEIHIFGLKEWDGDASFTKDGVYYHGLGQAKQFYTHGRRSIGEACYFGWKVLFPLLKEHFDIIDCQNFPYFSCFSAAFAATMRHSHLVITWHEVWKDYWTQYLGISGFPGKIIEGLASRLAYTMIAVSDLTKKDLISIRKEAKITIIPNGIDLPHINMIHPSDFISDIIFTGRLIKEKKVDLLILAMAIVRKEFPEIRCIIAGDGPEKESLQMMATGCNVEGNITFIGFLKHHDEVIALMKASKVCASPSTREGFGIAALEAMACGLPVVTVNAPKNAVMELVNKDTGIICDPTPKAFAEAVVSCLIKKDEMKNICTRSAGDYNWEKIVDKTEEFYSAIIKEG